MSDPGQRPSGDAFKRYELIQEPDRRQTVYATWDQEQKHLRNRTLKDHHDTIAAFELHDGVPSEVRIHFDTARNLLLYGWFAYRFIQVAELHAFAGAEMALRLRLEPEATKPSRFRTLLDQAVETGLIHDEGFRQFRRIREREAAADEAVRGLAVQMAQSQRDPQAYARRIANYMPRFRNELAHGSPMVMPHGYLWLGICCDLIGQLFASTPAAEHPRHEVASPEGEGG